MTGEMLTLQTEDAAALIVGRLILAWGKLDHLIENHTGFLYSASTLPHQIDGTDPPPRKTDGRANQRRKIFRRYFAAVTIRNPKALAQMDSLLARVVELEKIRSAFAHGSPLVSGGEDDATIEVGIFEPVPGESEQRTYQRSTYRLRELELVGAEVASVTNAIQSLSEGCAYEFTSAILHSQSANSSDPASSLKSGSSGSSTPASHALIYRPTRAASETTGLGKSRKD